MNIRFWWRKSNLSALAIVNCTHLWQYLHNLLVWLANLAIYSEMRNPSPLVSCRRFGKWQKVNCRSFWNSRRVTIVAEEILQRVLPKHSAEASAEATFVWTLIYRVPRRCLQVFLHVCRFNLSSIQWRRRSIGTSPSCSIIYFSIDYIPFLL